MEEAIGYVLSLAGVSHVIVGCKTPHEVDDNARIVRGFAPMDDRARRSLEERTRAQARTFTYYKGHP
jgi:predicted aldo/keto reductase-like oxidoreductase